MAEEFPKNNLEKTLTDLDSPGPEGHLVIDVFEKNNEIIVQSAIAGVREKDIDISLSKDALTIKGIRNKLEETNSHDYLHQEIHWGQFSRSIILPTEIDVDQAKATVKNGLLTIRLSKLAKKV